MQVLKGVKIIFQARCLEEENESLEVQILELKERMGVEGEDSTTSTTRGPPDYSLEAVVERLRREKVAHCRLQSLVTYYLMSLSEMSLS